MELVSVSPYSGFSSSPPAPLFVGTGLCTKPSGTYHCGLSLRLGHLTCVSFFSAVANPFQQHSEMKCI